MLKTMSDDHPLAILHQDYVKCVELTDVFVSVIQCKKQTASVVKALCDDFPLENLQHLKRVRSIMQFQRWFIASSSMPGQNTRRIRCSFV